MSSHVDSNGVKRLSISSRLPEELETTPPVAKEANSWTFTTLASAINIGLQILESPMGRSALGRLGLAVVDGWHESGKHQFGGDINNMADYVNRFLAALRNDFPYIIVCNIGSSDIIAEALRDRHNNWDGNLTNYQPKSAGLIRFNYSRVADMTEAASKMLPSGPAHSAETRRMSDRHKTFQFMFSCATAHELCHLFVGYLAQGDSVDYSRYTPPGVTYLDYHVDPNDMLEDPETGESGRWFERNLFGGSLEFYRDVGDDAGQCGIPFLVDENGLSWRLNPQCIHQLVSEPRQFEFPFPVMGLGYTDEERMRRGLVRLGMGQPAPPAPNRRLLMQALRERRLVYNVPGDELRQIPLQPRLLQWAVQVASG